MSSEPDYDFNQPSPTSTQGGSGLSLHLPFALLTAAIAIIFVQQTINSFKLKSSLNETKDQYAKASTSAVQQVDQAKAYEQSVQKLAEDLAILAQTDENAKAILTKLRIQVNPPSSAPAATPAPAK